MTARMFALALQALGVAALGAIVYFAFLQPSEPNPLSGIEVEGDVPAALTPGNGQATGAARNRREPSAGPARRGDGSGTLAGIRLVPVQPGAAIPVSPGAQVDSETPTGEQYDSAVARILGRVAGPER